MSQGMSGFRDLSQSFQQVYGLGSERPEGTKTGKRAHPFEKLKPIWMRWEWCPMDYLALQKQLEDLRQQTEGQEPLCASSDWS